jgi:hypothetical protein
VADQRAERDRGSSGASVSSRAGPTLEFAFGAAFTSIRTIPLRAGRGESLTVSDLLASASGRLWIADARAARIKVYSQQGWRLRTLGRDASGLRCPVSLALLYGRWVAALDGHTPAVSILDETGRRVRRFSLPELDRPVQLCSLSNRRLAVIGSGWGPGAGQLVHLYTIGGEYIESLFGEPRGAGASWRAFAAAAGPTLLLAHSATDSFAIYDVDARAVTSFPNLGADLNGSGEREAAGTLRGLFSTVCGQHLAMYARASGAGDYAYDLYGPEGTPIALGLNAAERVVGVEGPFFYSVHSAPDGRTTLRVWKLSLGRDGQAGPRAPSLVSR